MMKRPTALIGPFAAMAILGGMLGAVAPTPFAALARPVRSAGESLARIEAAKHKRDRKAAKKVRDIERSRMWSA